MKRFAENYARVQETLNELLQGEYSIADNSRAISKGYKRLLKRFETLLGINISIDLFGPPEELARVLQRIKEVAETLCEAMSRLRSEIAFEELWDCASSTAMRLGMKDPRSAKPTKPPKRFEMSNTPSPPVV